MGLQESHISTLEDASSPYGSSHLGEELHCTASGSDETIFFATRIMPDTPGGSSF